MLKVKKKITKFEELHKIFSFDPKVVNEKSMYHYIHLLIKHITSIHLSPFFLVMAVVK